MTLLRSASFLLKPSFSVLDNRLSSRSFSCFKLGFGPSLSIHSNEDNILVKTRSKSPSLTLLRSLTEDNKVNEFNLDKPVKKDRIITVPNLLCVSRIAATPVIASSIIQGDFFLSTLLFMYAGATDFLDGWIARRYPSQASSLGSFLDPLSDKILVCTTFFSLTYASIIPASLTSLIISRDLLLVYAGLYIRYMGVVPPFTWAKFFDPSLPTTTVQPTAISKVNTGLQFLLIWVSLLAPLVNLGNHPAHHYLWAATGMTTFLSAVSYAFMRDTYKFSHREYDHQFGKKLTAFIVFILFNLGFTYYFPVQMKKDSTGKECPITGQPGAPDPYNERTNQYYLKKIRESNK